MKYFVTSLALLILFASCRSSRTISKAVAKKDSAKSNTVSINLKNDSQQIIQNTLYQLNKNRIQFTTFSGKVDIDYKGADGKSRNVNANIKMYKDSTIWISITAILGYEPIRLLITKDSLKLLNKFDKIYIRRSVNYLQEITSLPLDLYTLQDLIIGNPVYLDSNIIRYTHTNGTISMLSLGRYFRNLVSLNEEDKTIFHSKLDDINPVRSRTADLSYSNYENKKRPFFSTKRQIVVTEKTKLDVAFEFKNYTFDGEVSFPFSIPKNYERQ